VNSAVAAYRQNTIDTAAPGQLVVMLYRGVLNSLGLIEAALGGGAKDIDLAHKELLRAQDIIMELLQTLDFSVQPIADHLAGLYQFCLTGLIESNVTKTFAPAEPVRKIFDQLADAWEQIALGEHAGA
jgi:flagellar protein FliS